MSYRLVWLRDTGATLTISSTTVSFLPFLGVQLMMQRFFLQKGSDTKFFFDWLAGR